MSNIDTAEVSARAAMLAAHIPTFQHSLKGLQDISDELSGSPLNGHFGSNGHYNGQLNRFSSKLMEVLAEFVEDEKGFVAFLQQFAENMKHVAGDYDRIESDNQQHMSNLTCRLDGGM